MIQVQLEQSKEGAFRTCIAVGHAGYGVQGSDIVCAGVTVLLRTALSQLEKYQDLTLKVNAQKSGELAFQIVECKDSEKEFLKYIADFLIEGIGRLASDYPENVTMRVKYVE